MQPSTNNDFWPRLLDVAHPSDLPLPESWRSYYGSLFNVVGDLAPKRICEIGVRAGYSAFTMLSANPEAYLLGIEADLDETRENTHGGRKGLYRHAQKILAGFHCDILIVNSHHVEQLPRFDLVYVDGDHTFDGCLSDLRLAARSAPLILVDDFCSIDSVRQACQSFLQVNPQFHTIYIENTLTGQLLLRNSSTT